MKYLLSAFLVGTLFIAAHAQEIKNPVLNKDFADPTIINHHGVYYAYATQGMYNNKLLNIQVASSGDLVHWTVLGDALPEKPLWANKTQDFWAPHVLYDEAIHKYVMFFSGKNNDTTYDKCIGVAFADSAAGPFVPKDTPLLKGRGFTEIDPMAIIDPATKKKVLYWGSGFQPIRVQELNDDWCSFKEGTSPLAILYPGKEKKYTHLLEGAWVDYHEGNYYLYFSGDNCCGERASYAVMVAKAASAFGPFKTLGEANGTGNSVILEKDSAWLAPGHNSVFKDNNGNNWIAYHAIPVSKATGNKPGKPNFSIGRVFCLNPMQYKNGWPVIIKKY